jgi:mannan endo-1,4-beta-mannosidase
VDEWTGKHLDIVTDPNFEKYILLNIANEWGDASTSFNVWTTLYSEVVLAMRDAGIRVPLVVDSLDCGHDVEVFGEGGQQVLDADPLGNVIFSVHGYCEWGSSRVDSNFDTIIGYGLPWFLGEFGDSERAICTEGDDHFAIMARAQEEGIGWCAWSWMGNGGADMILDMSNSHESAALTRRGEDIVNGPNGLMETSHRATYWSDF